jgi:hypothetical protein
VPCEFLLVPKQQGAIRLWKIIFSRNRLGSDSVRVHRVSEPEETSATRGRRVEHAVAAGVRCEPCDTVGRHMNPDSWPKPGSELFLLRSIHDLGDREISAIWMLSMQESRSDPNFVGDLDHAATFLVHRQS